MPCQALTLEGILCPMLYVCIYAPVPLLVVYCSHMYMYYVFILVSIFYHRERRIEENMRQMPQMIADYRKRVAELRKKTREKKQRTEEQQYLIATGKSQEGPYWEIFKEGRTKK